MRASAQDSPTGPVIVPPVSEDSEPQGNTPKRKVAEILRAAEQNLTPGLLPQVKPSRDRLRAAIAAVEDFVDIDSENGVAWSKFLRLEELQELLDAENPDFNQLVILEMHMRQNYAGLELAPFVELNLAIDQMVRALKFGSNSERTVSIIQARIADLLKTLEASPDNPMEVNQKTALVVNYLQESGIAPEAVKQLRSHFSQPNFRVVADEALLNRLVARPVAEPGPVNECILGTRVRGTACLSGQLSLDLLPRANGVSMLLNLNGTLTSNNKGYNRGVVLRTTGTSPVILSKPIYANLQQGISTGPTSISTNLQTRINAIEHKLRLVRKIAKRKAAEQKPQADAIAQGRMQRRMVADYDDQVASELAKAGDALNQVRSGDKVGHTLERLHFPEPELAFYSTDSDVNAQVVQASAHQLAAGSACPIPRPIGANAVIELHQSTLTNALESLLAGREIHHHDLDDLARQFAGSVPEEILAESQGDPWEVTLNSFHPIELAFYDNQVSVTMRLTHMEGNEREIPYGADITVTYQPQSGDRMLKLVRADELDITVHGIRSRNQATVLRSVVRKKFEEIFKPELEIDFTQLLTERPGLAKVRVERITADDGWMQVVVQ